MKKTVCVCVCVCVCDDYVSLLPTVCVYVMAAYTVLYVYSMFTYVHCCVLLVFQASHLPLCPDICVCVFVCLLCVFSKGTHSMTPAIIHYLWCLVYNIFALSRGPACN